MLLAPTAWRRKFFVRARTMCGPPRPTRYRSEAGEELVRARVGSIERGFRLIDHASSHACPLIVPLLCAHVSAVVNACRLYRIALRCCRCRSRSAWAAPRAKGFSRHDHLVEGATLLYSQPTGRKVPVGACAGGSVPGNTGRGAGDARCTRALKQVRARVSGGLWLARWGVGGA